MPSAPNTAAIAPAMPTSPSVKMTVGAPRCLRNCSNAQVKSSFDSPGGMSEKAMMRVMPWPSTTVQQPSFILYRLVPCLVS